MSGCRVRAITHLSAVLLCLTLSFGVSGALAQVGAPRSLVPKTLTIPNLSNEEDSTAGHPAEQAPPDTTGARDEQPEMPNPPGGTEADKQGIEVDRLAAVASDSIVVLDPDSGGFDPAIWAGTSRATFARWLRLLPDAPHSQVARAIAVRLLLSGAALPAREATEPPIDLLTLRAETLFRMGEHAGLRQLFDAIPARRESEALARIQVDHMLLRDDLARACQLAGRWMITSEDRYWQKIRVFCDALNGQWERVEFGIQLLFELGEQDDAFFSLMQHLGAVRAAGSVAQKDTPRITDTTGLRPLDFALVRVAGMAPPIDPARLPAPSVLGTLVGFANLPFETRLWLAEEGEARGLLPTEAVIRLFNAVTVGADQLESALTVAEADPGPNSRALLFRAAQTQSVQIAAAQAIQLALTQARAERRLDRAARLYLTRLNAIPAASELSWFAADAATGFLAAGRPALSLPWLALAKREALSVLEARPVWARLWALARLAGGDETVPWDEAALSNWWTEERTRDPATAADKAVLLFSLLEATGDPVSPLLWRDLVTGPTVRDGHVAAPAVRRALHSALAANRMGEALVLIVLSLGDLPLQEMHPDDLAGAVSALTRLGLTQEARALAIEVALSRGL